MNKDSERIAELERELAKMRLEMADLIKRVRRLETGHRARPVAVADQECR